MTFSKRIFSLTVLGLASLQAGCSHYNGDKGNNPEGNATFVVQTAQAVRVLSTQSDSRWNLPTVRTIQVRACISDVAFLNPIIGTEFTVVAEDSGTSMIAKTDSNGCLIWSEMVPFSFLSKETYYQRTKVISARSPHKGSIRVNLALDPWQIGDSSLVDLRYTSVDKLEREAPAGSEKLKSDSSDSKTASLVVNKIDFYFRTAQSVEASTTIPYKLTFEPTAVRTQLDGSGVAVPLPVGQFNLSLVLYELKNNIASDAEKVKIAEEKIQAEAKDGQVVVNGSFHLTALPANTSTFQMSFELSPLNGPVGLGSDAGRVLFDSIHGAGEGRVVRDSASAILPVPAQPEILNPTQRIADLGSDSSPKRDQLQSEVGLASPQANGNEKKPVEDCGDKDYTGGLALDSIEINHAGFSGQSGLQRTSNEIQVTLKACIKNAVDWRPVTHFGFEVGLVSKKDDPVSTSRETDLSGCLRWNETIKFDYTEAERWLPLYVKVVSPEAPFKDVTKTLKVFVNPWQVGWLHAWDCRTGMPPEVGSGEGGEPGKGSRKARIGVVEAALSFNGRDFSLAPSMKLTSIRKYRLQFRPLVIRQDLAHPTISSESVGDGKFRLRMALLKNEKDSGSADPKSRFLGGFEGEVEAKNGVVVKEIPFNFSFSDIPWISSRNEMIIEVSSLEEGSGLETSTWSTPVHISEDETMNTFVPSEINLPTLLKEGLALREAADKEQERAVDWIKGSATLQNLVGMNPLSSQELSTLGVQPEEFLGSNEEVMARAGSRLCALYFGSEKVAPDTLMNKLKSWVGAQPTEFEACSKKPSEFLDVSSGMKVDEIVGTPKEVQGDIFTISVNAMFSRSGSISTYAGQSFGLELELPLLGAALSSTSYMGVRADQSKTYSQNSLTLRTMTAEEVRLQFDVRGKQCTVVGPKLVAPVRKETRDLPRKFVCSTTTGPQVSLQESWYFVSQLQTYGATMLRDPRQMNERAWYRLIRGTHSFQKFKNELEDKDNNFVLVPFVVRKDIDDAGSQINSAVKGTFSPARITDDESFPFLVSQ